MHDLAFENSLEKRVKIHADTNGDYNALVAKQMLFVGCRYEVTSVSLSRCCEIYNRSSVTHLAVHHLPYFHLSKSQLYLIAREINDRSAVLLCRCAHANCLDLDLV